MQLSFHMQSGPDTLEMRPGRFTARARPRAGTSAKTADRQLFRENMFILRNFLTYNRYVVTRVSVNVTSCLDVEFDVRFGAFFMNGVVLFSENGLFLRIFIFWIGIKCVLLYWFKFKDVKYYRSE